jgi:RHS repeat-associated protein
VISSLSYRAFGATSVVSYGNGRRLTLGYDTNRHQMTSMLVDNQNGTDRIIDKTYHYTTQSSQQTYYDNDGRIKKIADNLDPNYTATYTYDAYNRLATARGGSQLWPTYYRQYSYDAWGNLGAVFTSPDNLNATSYSVGLATNRISGVTTQIAGWTTQTVSYTWDAAGNLTNDGLRTYTYDAAGRQKEAGAVGQNTVGYDGDGQRVRKVENWGTPVYYVRSSVLKQAAMEVVGGTLARAYVYTGKKLVAQQSTDGQFYWVHQDHLNSARKLTNTSGAVVYRGEFDPHGEALLETGSALLNSRKYTGYERDQATGLDYANARMYASNAARFTSPDPISLRSADPRRPESLNRYSYVENDSINSIDPGGTNLEAPDGSSRRSCRFIYGFRGPDEEDIYTFGVVGISCTEVGSSSGTQTGGGGEEWLKNFAKGLKREAALNRAKKALMERPECADAIKGSGNPDPLKLLTILEAKGQFVEKDPSNEWSDPTKIELL